MRHGRLREQLSDYLDGQLSTRELRRMDRHLARCAACREELEGLRRTVDWLRQLPAPEAPPGLETRLLARIEEAAEREAARRRWPRMLLPATSLVGAAALFLVFVDVDVSVDWPGSPALREAELESITLSARPYEAPPAPPRSPSLFLPAGSGRPAPAAAQSGTAHSREAQAGAAPAQTVQVPPAAMVGELRVVEPGSRVVPSMRACLSAGSRQACSQWQSWMLDLAQREPRAFVSEFEAVPESEQPLILQDMRELAWGTGTAAFVIDRLRSSGDPRATSLASRLAFAAARGER